jgi:FkbM family methyltransferase
MEFVSYAQNYEDVVLWRALANVEQGFYVDVGAADPVLDSVTLAFYERGWSGVNIEPVPEFYEKLKAARTRDINLQLAVAEKSGCRMIHGFDGTGLSTLNGRIAEGHEQHGYSKTDLVVPVLPLSTIFHDQSLDVVHFLKIDAEGSESDVLNGIDLERWRPWIILVEATEPNDTVSTRRQWEHLIIERGYNFAYFDGLNCFYVAREHAELAEKLSLSPNYFDHFVRFSERTALDRLAELETSMRASDNHRRSLEQALEERNELLRENSSRVATYAARISDLEQHCNELQVYTERLFNLLQAQNEQQEWRDKLREQLDEGAALRNELSALVARVDALAQRVETPPSRFKAGFAVLRSAGNRLTGGGLRSLAKRTLQPALRSLARIPWFVSFGRTLLKPFPRLSGEVWRLSLSSETSEEANKSTHEEQSSSEDIVAGLTGPARERFERLRRAGLGDNDPR